jgi:hypothetical protein
LQILVFACQDAVARLALWYSKDAQALACLQPEDVVCRGISSIKEKICFLFHLRQARYNTTLSISISSV